MKIKLLLLLTILSIAAMVIWYQVTQRSFLVHEERWDSQMVSLKQGYYNLTIPFLDITNNIARHESLGSAPTAIFKGPIIIVDRNSLHNMRMENGECDFHWFTLPPPKGEIFYSLSWWFPLLEKYQPRAFSMVFTEPQDIKTVILVELARGEYVGEYTPNGLPANIPGPRAYMAYATARIFDVENNEFLYQQKISAAPGTYYPHSPHSKKEVVPDAFMEVVKWVAKRTYYPAELPKDITGSR